MKLRDIIAIPFWGISILCDMLAVKAGGAWTSDMYKKGVIRQYNQIHND